MRLGYGIANEYIISNLYKLRPPFNITTLSLKAGIVALKDEEFVSKSIKNNFLEMKKYEDFCKKKNLEYIPSWTNFITIFVENSTKLSDELLKIGIIIRNLKSYNLEAVRITIGSSEQNDKVIKMLDKLI